MAIAPIPAIAGIGLRAAHYQEFLGAPAPVGWVEVHSENFFSGGGRPIEILEKVRGSVELSVHGVGLSLGSADEIDQKHLARLRGLIDRVEPAFVSEHLSWGSINGHHVNDLLPVPYTSESLELMTEKVNRVQEALGRQILIENISAYLAYNHDTLSEPEFLAKLARRTGCGILLDVNNVYVSSQNLNFDPAAYLQRIPADAVREIHLAGHSRRTIGARVVLVDTHDDYVCDDVWRLFEITVALFGPRPTLIEWDARLPALADLLSEARKAAHYLEPQDVAA